MNKNHRIDKFFFLAFHEGLLPDPYGSRIYFNILFKNISFDKKTMIDIGGGAGLFSFYAASMGAKSVICIEPEAAGSKQGLIEKFKKLQSDLKTGDQVKLETTTFQDFNSRDKKFDIILLHNSINHLDEEACIKLKYDSHAIEIYKTIFRKLGDLAGKGATLIIADCSRYNFFALFNLKNPFAPTIEWHKHQSPKYWARLLSDAGFCNPDIRWNIFNQRLRFMGKLPFVGKFASYFRRSHFCLTMEKREAEKLRS
jgi:hypothetical protein